jgi:pimeloyl-ACP methyl ester carboxylesterase
VVFFTGNSGNMGMRMETIELLATKLQFNVFILSYRGYGLSTGTPSERGLQLDIEAAVKYVFEEASIDNSKVLFFGRSLGGAAAIYAASCLPKYSCRGLILEITFTSMADIVDYHLPLAAWFKGLILCNHWPSILRISSICVPILFVSGRNDRVVPPSHMDRLYRAASQAPYKVMHEVPSGSHGGTWKQDTRYVEWLLDFTQRCLN